MKGVSKTSIQTTYHEKFKIDLVNNKKEAILVNALATIVMLLLLIPIQQVFVDMGSAAAQGEMGSFLNKEAPRFLLAAVLVLLYIPGHEAVHGIAMKCFTGEKLRFGWKFVYAYAGSNEGLFTPVEYSIVALAPVVVFHLLFVLLLELFPSLRLVWIFLIAMNVSGAMGDFYVFCRIAPKWKQKLLVNDTGTDMMVYEAN